MSDHSEHPRATHEWGSSSPEWWVNGESPPDGWTVKGQMYLDGPDHQWVGIEFKAGCPIAELVGMLTSTPKCQGCGAAWATVTGPCGGNGKHVQAQPKGENERRLQAENDRLRRLLHDLWTDLAHEIGCAGYDTAIRMEIGT